MSFAARFQAGSDIASDLMNTYESAKDRKALNKISASEQTEGTQFDEATAQALSYAADQKNADGSATYAVTPNAKGGYGLQPRPNADTKNENGEIVSMAGEAATEYNPAKTYTFMGKSQDTAFSPAEQTRAKQAASADVISRRDPKLGLAMRSAAASEERAAQSFDASQKMAGLQMKALERQDKTASAGDAADGVQKQFFSSLVDANGKQRAPTDSEVGTGMQIKAQHLFQNGQQDAGERAWNQASQLLVHNVARQGVERDQAFAGALSALGTGNTSPLVEAYNKFIPDGYQVKSIEKNPDGSLSIHRTDLAGRAVSPETTSTLVLAKNLEMMKDPRSIITYAQQSIANQLAARKSDVDERAVAAKERHNEVLSERSMGLNGAGSKRSAKDEHATALETILTKSENKLTPDQVGQAQDLVQKIAAMAGATSSPEQAARVAVDASLYPAKVKPQLNLQTGTWDNYYSDPQIADGKRIQVAGNVMTLDDIKGKDKKTLTDSAAKLLSTMGNQTQQAALLQALASPAERAEIEKNTLERGGQPALDIMKRKLDILQLLAPSRDAGKDRPATPGLFGEAGPKLGLGASRAMQTDPASEAGKFQARRVAGSASDDQKNSARQQSSDVMSRQFQRDAASMAPLALAQKYDALRGSLSSTDAAALFAIEKTIR